MAILHLRLDGSAPHRREDSKMIDLDDLPNPADLTVRQALAEMEAMLSDLESVDDETAARAAHQAWLYGNHVLLPVLAARRRGAVRGLRGAYSLTELGAMLGVSDSRIAQICR